MTCLIWQRLHCALMDMDLFSVLRYNFRTGSALSKSGRKQCHPLMTKLNMQSEKETVLNLRGMISFPSGILETIYNIHQNVLCITSAWPSMPFISVDPVRARNNPSRAWTTTPFLHFPGDYPSNTSIVSRTLRLRFNETVYNLEEAVGPPGRHPMFRPEQNSVDATRHVLQMFAPLKSTVMDPCFGTDATVKACPLGPKYQNFYRCDADAYCLDLMMASLLEVFSRQVLIIDLDIREDLKVEKAAEALLKGRKTGRSVRRKQVWRHPRSLPPVQTFPHQIVQFLSQYNIDMTFYNNNNTRQFPCTL